MIAGEQPLPPEDMPVEVLLEAQKTRRWVNGAIAGGLAAVGAFELDQFVTDLIWLPGGDVAVSPVPKDADLCSRPDWWEEVVWLGCPGMAHESGLPVALAMANVLSHVGERKLSMYVRLANTGITAKTYPAVLDFMRPRCDRLAIGGWSMGGAAPIEGARVLKATTGKEVRFGHVALIGTPFRMKNVREEHAAEVLADIGKVYPGGITGNFLTEVGTAIKNDRRAFLGDILGGLINAGRRAVTGVSPKIKTSGLVFLDGIDLARDWRDVRHAFDSDTKIGFVGSGKDDVVDCRMAIEDWGNFAADVGCQFEDFWSENTGHANVEVASDKLKDWVV